jgi:hypothetical protein
MKWLIVILILATVLVAGCTQIPFTAPIKCTPNFTKPTDVLNGTNFGNITDARVIEDCKFVCYESYNITSINVEKLDYMHTQCYCDINNCNPQKIICNRNSLCEGNETNENCPEDCKQPIKRGFNTVMPIPPWDLNNKGELKIFIVNNFGSDVVIRKIYINEISTSSSDLPLTISNGQQSKIITMSDGPGGRSGESYSIRISVEFYNPSMGGVGTTCSDSSQTGRICFNSTGTLTGTYS